MTTHEEMLKKPFLTIKEVSLWLGLSKNTVEKHLREGSLKGTRFGRTWRIRPHDVLAWGKSNQDEDDVQEKAKDE